MIEDLVKNLRSFNHELQMHCANAIFKVIYFFFTIFIPENFKRFAKGYIFSVYQLKALLDIGLVRFLVDII